MKVTIPTSAMLRAAAQELIDRSEELIGDTSGVTGIDVWIRLRPEEVPEITVSKDYKTVRQMASFIQETENQRRMMDT